MHISKSLPTLADICFSVKARPARLSLLSHVSGRLATHQEMSINIVKSSLFQALR